LIELPDGELPKVKGSDDAKTAQWIPISQVDSSMMFEDHAQMIQEMIGV
jgi:bifunctional NMN adenylyltransferase/nudix hydrolase